MQVSLFIKFWHFDSQISDLLPIDISWYQYQTGVSISLLSDVTTVVPHSKSLYFESICSFLKKINGKILLDDDYIFPLQRQNDFCLMSKFLEDGLFTKRQLKLINYFRLYYGVLLASDIVTADGKTIHYSYFEEDNGNCPTISLLDTPVQEQPNHSSFLVWKRALTSLLTRHKLSTPLGKWIVQPSKAIRKWY